MELCLLFLLLLPLSVVAENGLWKDVLEIGREISDFLHQENSHQADLSKQDNSPVISSVNRGLRQASTLNCNELSTEDLEAVMACIELKTKTSYILQVKKVDEDKWKQFTSKLDTIRVDVEIDQSSITDMILPALDTFSTKSKLTVDVNLPLFTEVAITNNQNLKNIDITVTNEDIKIEELIIIGNSQLSSIKIKSDGFTGSITIKDNKMLETLELDVPSITTKPQSGAAGLIIENNPKLGSIKMDRTNINFAEGTMQIISNQNLASLDFSNATQFILPGGVVISKNENLDSIKLPSAASAVSVLQMEIKQNFNLKSIDSVEKFPSTALTIRGNPGLPQEVLDKVPVNGNNMIQEQGECIFDEEVSNLNTLTACQYIDGPLKFANGATGSVPDGHQLSKINGDVFLADLPPNQLGFLGKIPNGGVKGKISTGVCGYVPNIGIHAIIQPACAATPSASSTDPSNGSTAGGNFSGPTLGNKSLDDVPSAAPDNTNTQQSKPSIAAIVLAAIIGIFVVGLLVGAILFGWRKYRAHKKEKAEEEKRRKERMVLPDFGLQTPANVQLERDKIANEKKEKSNAGIASKSSSTTNN